MPTTTSTSPLISSSSAPNRIPSRLSDPKLYVDLPLKKSLSITETASDANGSVPAEGLGRSHAGSDLLPAEPMDFVPEPEGFLPDVEHEEFRAWALEVHSLWKNLSSRVSGGVRENQDLHTLLPLPEPVVVPGSRFWS